MRLLSIMLVCIAVLTLNACGSKGALYLPSDQAKSSDNKG